MSEEPKQRSEEAKALLAEGAQAGDYDSSNVQIFRDAAHIRQRPGMYIGNVASSGLHHLVYELVYNSVDEALAGYCKNIQVKIQRRRQPAASPTTAAAFPSRSIPRPSGRRWKSS